MTEFRPANMVILHFWFQNLERAYFYYVKLLNGSFFFFFFFKGRSGKLIQILEPEVLLLYDKYLKIWKWFWN